MRRWIAVPLVVGIAAAAIALPAAAMHVQIALRIVGDDRLELPFITDPENQQYLARFAWGPPADPLEGDNLFVCWNGRFDRSQLTSNRQPNEFCSSGSNGAQTGEVEGATGRVAPIQAGRYEVFVKRYTPCQIDCYPPPPPHWNASNVVAFEAVDPCRLRLVSLRTRGFHFPVEVGSPMSCATLLDNGELQAVGEDGSRIALTGAGAISVDYVTSNPFTSRPTPGPIFRLRAGGNPAALTFTTGGRLGGLVTSASTGAVHALAVARASVRLTFRNNVGRIHVRSGRVVALGVGPYEAALEIERYCGRRRPTIACLSKMRYRFFTMKRGTSIKARVLRAGQSATFRRRRGVIKFVR